jgi:hypothetical protein
MWWRSVSCFPQASLPPSWHLLRLYLSFETLRYERQQVVVSTASPTRDRRNPSFDNSFRTSVGGRRRLLAHQQQPAPHASITILLPGDDSSPTKSTSASGDGERERERSESPTILRRVDNYPTVSGRFDSDAPSVTGGQTLNSELDRTLHVSGKYCCKETAYPQQQQVQERESRGERRRGRRRIHNEEDATFRAVNYCITTIQMLQVSVGVERSSTVSLTPAIIHTYTHIDGSQRRTSFL